MNTETTLDNTAANTVREYLTFALATEEYAVDILDVQEIRSYEAVTPIHGLPALVKGIINLRGDIVPVVDLRIKFKLGSPRYDGTTALIVLNMAGRIVALVVDGVSDVVALAPSQIRPAPQFGAVMDTRFLSGLGTLGERMLILLDIAQVLSSEELALVSAPLKQAA